MLANIIDTWNASGNQFLGFLRVFGFPILVIIVCVGTFARSGRSFGAVLGVIALAALVAIPVYNPGALGGITTVLGF